MQSRPRPSAAQNRHTYVPPSVQQSLNQQLQRTAPAHLKKYVGTGAYVPQHAQKALEQHIQQAAPGHLQQYAGAFVQQNVVQPGLSGGSQSPTAPPSRPPAPNPMRLDHSNVPGSQHEAQFHNLFQPDQQPAQGQVVTGGQPQQQPNSPYDFLLTSEQPKRGFNLPGGNNKLARVAFILGGLLIVLILFSLLKGLFSNNQNLAPYLTVAQDQQALIHLTKATPQQLNELSAANKNYVFTSKLSLTSAQTELISYLNSQHYKVNTKQLNLRVSTSADKQLVDALTAGTYNNTYHDLAEAKLKTYLADLDKAYKTSSGPKGKALLKHHYAQAQLLLKQLNASPI